MIRSKVSASGIVHLGIFLLPAVVALTFAIAGRGLGTRRRDSSTQAAIPGVTVSALGPMAYLRSELRDQSEFALRVKVSNTRQVGAIRLSAEDESCSCFAIDIERDTLLPGESAVLKINARVPTAPGWHAYAYSLRITAEDAEETVIGRRETIRVLADEEISPQAILCGFQSGEERRESELTIVRRVKNAPTVWPAPALEGLPPEISVRELRGPFLTQIPHGLAEAKWIFTLDVSKSDRARRGASGHFEVSIPGANVDSRATHIFYRLWQKSGVVIRPSIVPTLRTPVGTTCVRNVAAAAVDGKPFTIEDCRVDSSAWTVRSLDSRPRTVQRIELVFAPQEEGIHPATVRIATTHPATPILDFEVTGSGDGTSSESRGSNSRTSGTSL